MSNYADWGYFEYPDYLKKKASEPDMVPLKRLKFRVIYNGIVYEMPRCRLKISCDGGVTSLIKNDDDKWIAVKGNVEILNVFNKTKL